ncbi:hypothetical protein B1218_36670, partial [Pseudomonas ogarae]
RRPAARSGGSGDRWEAVAVWPPPRWMRIGWAWAWWGFTSAGGGLRMTSVQGLTSCNAVGSRMEAAPKARARMLGNWDRRTEGVVDRRVGGKGGGAAEAERIRGARGARDGSVDDERTETADAEQLETASDVGRRQGSAV